MYVCAGAFCLAFTSRCTRSLLEPALGVPPARRGRLSLHAPSRGPGLRIGLTPSSWKPWKSLFSLFFSTEAQGIAASCEHRHFLVFLQAVGEGGGTAADIPVPHASSPLGSQPGSCCSEWDGVPGWGTRRCWVDQEGSKPCPLSGDRAGEGLSGSGEGMAGAEGRKEFCRRVPTPGRQCCGSEGACSARRAGAGMLCPGASGCAAGAVGGGWICP